MKRIGIIGAGLAGAACAYVLGQRGFQVTLYEREPHIAPAASGNETALYNPRLSAGEDGFYFKRGFELACRIFPLLPDIEWNPCGSLHLVTTPKRAEKFQKILQCGLWSEQEMQTLTAAQASHLAGIALEHSALYMPGAGTVSPRKLCAALTGSAEIIFNADIQTIKDIDADMVILACGAGIKKFEDASALPLVGVRGQITYVETDIVAEKLACNLCYGGYLSPAINGRHALGATFQRWLDHTDIRAEDDDYNIAQLTQAVPLLKNLKIAGHRASLRMVVPDHLPVVGSLVDDVYISAAHGSHGVVSSLAAAQQLAALITGEEPILTAGLMKKISPARFESRRDLRN